MGDGYIAWDEIGPVHLRAWSAAMLLYTLGHDLVLGSLGAYLILFRGALAPFSYPALRSQLDEMSQADEAFRTAGRGLQEWRVRQLARNQLAGGDHVEPQALAELRALIDAYVASTVQTGVLFDAFLSQATPQNDEQATMLGFAAARINKQRRIAELLQEWRQIHGV